MSVLKETKDKVLRLLDSYQDNTQAFNTMKSLVCITFNQALQLPLVNSHDDMKQYCIQYKDGAYMRFTVIYQSSLLCAIKQLQTENKTAIIVQCFEAV